MKRFLTAQLRKACTFLMSLFNVLPPTSSLRLRTKASDAYNAGTSFPYRVPPDRSAQSNKSEFPTDKSQKQRSLHLTRGIGAMVFQEINARGDILETERHDIQNAVLAWF